MRLAEYVAYICYKIENIEHSEERCLLIFLAGCLCKRHGRSASAVNRVTIQLVVAIRFLLGICKNDRLLFRVFLRIPSQTTEKQSHSIVNKVVKRKQTLTTMMMKMMMKMMLVKMKMKMRKMKMKMKIKQKKKKKKGKKTQNKTLKLFQ